MKGGKNSVMSAQQKKISLYQKLDTYVV